MADCQITSITNPTSSSEFDLGETVNVTWVSSIGCNNDWEVLTIKLQRFVGSIWSDLATLFSGNDRVNSNSQSVTIPNSVPVYDDVYRLKITYEEGGL